jgi:hypothetical protein
MLPRLFQLSRPSSLKIDAGRPMLVRIKRLRKPPRSRGCQHRRPDAKCLIRDILANPRLS